MDKSAGNCIYFVDHDDTLARGIFEAVSTVLDLPEIKESPVRDQALENPESFIKRYISNLNGVSSDQIAEIGSKLIPNDEVIKYVREASLIDGNSLYILTENPLTEYIFRDTGGLGLNLNGIYATFPLEMYKGRLVVPKGAKYTPKTDIARQILHGTDSSSTYGKACIITDGGGLDKQLEPHLIENGFPKIHKRSEIGHVKIIYLSR
jgi:hypothetical protein